MEEEGGDIKYFLTNAPPRNRKSNFIESKSAPEQSPLGNSTVERPKKKRRSPPSTPPGPEIQRCYQDLGTPPDEVSGLDNSRDSLEISIPCSNSFHLLAEVYDEDEPPCHEPEDPAPVPIDVKKHYYSFCSRTRSQGCDECEPIVYAKSLKFACITHSNSHWHERTAECELIDINYTRFQT